MTYAFIDEQRHAFGIEPIYEILQVASSTYRRHAERAKDSSLLSPSALKIEQVWSANFQIHGADKVWKQMSRAGVRVARCTVERLMRCMGLQEARRGKVVRTTMLDTIAPCPLDRVNRHCKADRPDQSCVSDFTYVST